MLAQRLVELTFVQIKVLELLLHLMKMVMLLTWMLDKA